MSLLSLESVDVVYANANTSNRVVHDFSMRLEQGEIVCLLGPSGCGKTTVLRAIAGFEPITAGRILLDERVLSLPGRLLAPEERHVGMMFQDYALFPHLTVESNIRFGLHKWDKKAAKARVEEMLELVGLSQFIKRYPHELSGGQQQRVALARAIAPKPRLLLLDEAFSNLDVDTRERLAMEVRDILKQNNLSAILVTHHQSEALAMGDRIAWMHCGQLSRWVENQHKQATLEDIQALGAALLHPGARYPDYCPAG
ncbi:ABC transporter [Oligella urethralis]|uniref:ABC transporter ATP-binding protein n=1 Tax=Oligella urethralis TaxID=90245 RepID=UPI000C9C60A5|nr:ABC transporter ATP-binding protein [Oligella urethralis]PMC16581.1 ABC transporter [Oligella urethralis]